MFAQTLERATEIGLETELLPTWYDVDDAATLERLRHELRVTRRESRRLRCHAHPHYLESLRRNGLHCEQRMLSAFPQRQAW